MFEVKDIEDYLDNYFEISLNDTLYFHLKENEEKTNYSPEEIYGEILEQRQEFIDKYNKIPKYIKLLDEYMKKFIEIQHRKMLKSGVSTIVGMTII